MPGGLRINITSENEHVPYIELRIRVVKERIRAARHSLPFNNTPKLLTVYIFSTVVSMLNHFPVNGGVSAILIPKTVISGDTTYYK